MQVSLTPTKVTRVALENAASVSGMPLTTECVITKVKSAEPAMPMGGGMPRCNSMSLRQFKILTALFYRAVFYFVDNSFVYRLLYTIAFTQKQLKINHC